MTLVHTCQMYDLENHKKKKKLNTHHLYFRKLINISSPPYSKFKEEKL